MILFEVTCKCGHTFDSEEAEFCTGCPKYRTLACPACGICVCDKIDKWKAQGKMVATPNDERFEFVHKDYL